MSLIKEFKDFAVRGNVVDLAVGIVIGVAFGKIISSLVSDVIMPPIGLLLGGVDFSSLAITLKEGTPGVPPVMIKYGTFINTIIDFLIISAAIFLVVKGINTLKREEAPKVVTRECPECKMTIPVDALRCGHCTSTL